MISLGEADIRLFGGRTIGHCRVRSIGPDPALYPRLRVGLGMTLNVFRGPETEYSPREAPLTSFRLFDIRGELRLHEHGPAVGILHWLEKNHNIRAWPHATEHQLNLVCELDRTRLEALERHRAGGPLRLSVALVPTFVQPFDVDPAERRDPLEVEIQPFRITVYQEQWTEYLQATGYGVTDIIEVRYDLAAAESFQRAIEHLRAARALLLAGDYNKAVAICRKVWEALEKAPFEKGAIEVALTRATHAKRVEQYTGIVSRLKQLSNIEVHDQPDSPTYSRREAQFVIGTTEFMLGLIAEGTVSS